MKIPTNKFNPCFSIQDKSGKEIPFETLDKEAHDFWNKEKEIEQIPAGAYPYKNVFTPKISWPDVLHYAFENKKEGIVNWKSVDLEVTKYLTTQAGKQLLDYHGPSTERKYHMLLDYYEIIGAYYNLFEFWKNERKYELVSVLVEK